MIYIASKTKHAWRWKRLRNEGFPINSTWIDEAGVGQSESLKDLWCRCISEASHANALIAYREHDEILKGAFVEIGAALAHNRDVFVVGFDEDQFSFKHHPNVNICTSMTQALRLALLAHEVRDAS